MKTLRIVLVFVSAIVVSTVARADGLTVDDIGANYQWLRYPASDGGNRELFVFHPPDHKPGDRRTAVVCIHGGGWTSGRPEYFLPHCHYFASRGAVAFSIGYRLVTEKGPEALDKVGVCIADCKAALRHIRKNADTFGIDPDRIVVMGDSAGGHLAACLGTMEGYDLGSDTTVNAMADAVVCYNPCIDMKLPLVLRIFGIGQGAGGSDGSGNDPEVKKRAEAVSPINHVRAGLSPTLVMHGMADTVIPVEQARRYADAMKRAGNRCDLTVLDGVSHAFVIVGIGTEETIVKALRTTDEFLGSLGFLEGEPTIELKKNK